MKNRIVRPAELKDAEGIAKVHIETWQHAYVGLMPESYLSSLSVEKRTERWKDILSHLEENAKTFIVEVDDTLVGFGSFGACRDEDMASGVGEVWAIYVDKNYMGKGVGSALLQKGIAYLRTEGYTRATLWVLKSNEKARKWYVAKGWTVEGKEKIEKSHGFDIHEVRYATPLQ